MQPAQRYKKNAVPLMAPGDRLQKNDSVPLDSMLKFKT